MGYNLGYYVGLHYGVWIVLATMAVVAVVTIVATREKRPEDRPVIQAMRVRADELRRRSQEP